MALNGVFAAQATGSAVPLSFILAMVAIASVAFSFVHLTRHFAHSGSVYAFNGVTLGAKVGFFSGWALLGTFTLLVAYALTAIGAMRFFGARPLWTWQHAIPLFSVLALGFTLYSNIYPVPTAPYNIFPYVALAWLLIGGGIVLASPALVARVGLRLSELEPKIGTETQIQMPR